MATPLPARLLAVALGLSLACGLGTTLWGCFVLADDPHQHGAEMDDVRAVVGTVLVGAGAVWSVVHVGLCAWLAHSLRRLRPLTAVGLVTAAVGALLFLVAPVPWSGPADPVVLLASPGLSGLLVGAGLSAAVSGRARTPRRSAPAPRR